MAKNPHTALRYHHLARDILMNKLITMTSIISLMFLSAFTVRAETIRLANGEWAPYVSKDLKHYGVFSHIVSEAFALEGIEVEYEFFPWKRSYKYAADGEFDGSLTWAPTPEREKDFYFTEPVTYNKKVFFHLKSQTFNWNKLSDLKGLNIGTTAQYTYGDEFDNAANNKEISVFPVNKDEQNVKKLLAGRIDIFPMEIEVGYGLIHSQLTPAQAALFSNHPKPVTETPICVVISKKLPAERAKRLVEAFNRGLAKLKGSGKYEEYIWKSRQGNYLQN
jgi:polar amino acid transport system substrate-binding protein